MSVIGRGDGRRMIVMDRATWWPGRGWVDLATNTPVTVVDASSSPLSLADWQARCAALVSCWHSHLVPLVDYALVQSTTGMRRIELYPAFAPANGRDGTQLWIRRAVADFLARLGLRCDIDGHRIVRVAGGAALLPGPETGTPILHAHDAEAGATRAGTGSQRPPCSGASGPGRGGRPVAPRRAVGVSLEAPRWLEAVLHAIDGTGVDSPQLVGIHGAPRSGISTCVQLLAREARCRGVVPLCSPVATHQATAASLARRTAVLLVDEPGNASAEVARALAALLHHDVRVPAVILARHGLRRPHDLILHAMPASRLARRIVFFPSRSPVQAARVVTRGEAVVGRVVASWLQSSSSACRATWQRRRGTVRAGAIGRELSCGDGFRVAEGAPRSAVRGTAHNWAPAALTAAWHALAAGHVRAARRAFAQAAPALRRGSSGVGAEALWGLGVCALESARLDESERWLRAAACAMDAADDVDARARVAVSCALARCLVWQGRLRDALPLVSTAEQLGEGSWQICRARARLEALQGRVAVAVRGLDRALGLASDDPRGRAAIHGDLGRIHLGLGDRRAASVHVAVALEEARRARDHGRWRRLSVARLALTTSIPTPPAQQAVRRMAHRIFRGDVPLLVRLRAARTLEAAGWPRRREVSAFIERWGGTALETGLLGETPMVSDLQAVLEICRDTDEAQPALDLVCHCVRDRLHAASVAIHGAPRARGRLALSGPAKLAADGLAQRLLESGTSARAAPGESGVEAGAPIIYAGHTIGAVVCRWTVASPVDAGDAEALLVTAATALAPHLHSVLDGDGRRARAAAEPFGLLGGAPGIVALRERVHRVALAPFHVLIEGESGSGKEVVARALHGAGPRRHRRFCALNCAALSDELVEAELFGHARGAFTGAVGERPGLFEEADGGTLFLDEVGELSSRAQAKLLRVIQDGEVRRVGENLPRRVDPRIVAATNRDLREDAAQGRFRADLLYRLDVVRIVVPPLRERPEDVALLARTFWKDAVARLGSRASLHPDTLAALARYHWPGNVRELQNVIAALAVNAPTHGVIRPARLPATIAAQTGTETAVTLDAARRSFEQRFVRAALARAGHRPGRAARDLGLTRQGLRKLLMRLQIDLSPLDPGRWRSACDAREAAPATLPGGVGRVTAAAASRTR